MVVAFPDPSPGMHAVDRWRPDLLPEMNATRAKTPIAFDASLIFSGLLLWISLPVQEQFQACICARCVYRVYNMKHKADGYSKV